MIAKTSSGKSFGRLMHYLEVGRSGHAIDRVDWTVSRNLCGVDSPQLAGRMMEATAEQSLRVQMPVYHVSVAFDPSDAVDRERMELVGDRLLRRLGLEEHQTVFVAHRDTDHAHFHIVVNRVHPETGVAWDRFQDRPRIERELRGLERELELREVPGRLYRALDHELPERSLDTSGERHAAERTHEMSFADKVRQHVPELRQARSWEDLAERLARHGLKIEARGQGIVITDGDERQVKGSRVARDFSVNRLERKFDAPFPGRVFDEPGHEIEPAMRSLVRDIRAYDRVTQYEKELREAVARARDAAQHAHAIHRAADDWRRRGDAVTQLLGRVYQSPEQAREHLAAYEQARGKDWVANELHHRPEEFGKLRTVEREGLLGVTRRDDRAARNEAPLIAPRIDEYRAAAQALRSHLVPGAGLTQDLVGTAERAAAIARERAQSHVRELREAGRTLPDRQALERRIGERARTLSPAEMRILRTFITDAQTRLAEQFKGKVYDMALDRNRGRELER